jgi:hypothetical protein
MLRERVTIRGRERVGGGCGTECGAKRISLVSEKLLLLDLGLSGIGRPGVRSVSSAVARVILRKARVPKATRKTVVRGPVHSTSALDGGEMVWMTNAVAAVSIVPKRYNRLAR